MRCLKTQLPNAEVHFLTKKKFKAVTDQNPYIDKFFYYDDNLSDLKQLLRREKYDYVIDLHKNFRSYLIRFALKTKTLSYKKLSIQKWLLTKLHINLMPKKHITERCLAAVYPLGIKDDGFGLDYFIAEKDTIPADEIPVLQKTGFIAIVIGASYFTKKLPVEKLLQLCNELEEPIILIGGPEDAAAGTAIENINPAKIYNACGKYNLNQSADLVRKAMLVISHDTGLQYIACAFKKPVLAIWGGTSPMLDVEPYYGFLTNNEPTTKFTFQNFIVPALPCQPCSNFGTKNCPRGHFKCMLQQDMINIALQASKILKGL